MNRGAYGGRVITVMVRVVFTAPSAGQVSERRESVAAEGSRLFSTCVEEKV